MTTYKITRSHLREAVNNPAPYAIEALALPEDKHGAGCHYTHPSIPNCHCVIGVAMLKAGVPADHAAMHFWSGVSDLTKEHPEIVFEDHPLASNLQSLHDTAVGDPSRRKNLIQNMKEMVP